MKKVLRKIKVDRVQMNKNFRTYNLALDFYRESHSDLGLREGLQTGRQANRSGIQ
jgi:hypothetical protein